MKRERGTARSRGLGLALVLMALTAQGVALGGGFIWDDDDYVTANPNLVEPGGLRRIWTEPRSSPQYYPLTFTTFWLEQRAWGFAPLGYHATNILLHAACALLAWRILVRLGVPGAFFGAALFAVHPVHVESVAWITERKNVLSGALALGAALAWLRSEGFDGARELARPKRHAVWLAAAYLLHVLALLAKTVVAPLPVALLLGSWWRHGRIERRHGWSLLPMVGIGAVLGLTTAWLEKHHVGAGGAHWDLSLPDRVLVAGRAAWTYLAKLAWPHPLAFFYRRWDVDAGSWWQWLFPALLVALIAVLAIAARRIGRGPLVALLAFLVLLFPALGFLDVYPMRYSFVADHFQYLASLPILAWLAAAGTTLLAREGKALRIVAAAGGTAVLLGFAWLAARHAADFRDSRTLWTATLRVNPHAFVAHSELGLMALQAGDIGEAERRFRRALDIEPRYPEALTNLGLVLSRRGRDPQALALHEEALAVQPSYLPAWVNLCAVRSRLGTSEAAMRACEEAIRLSPNTPQAHFLVASLHLGAGRAREAVEHLTVVVNVLPYHADARVALADALEQSGALHEAVAQLEVALRLAPDHPGASAALVRLHEQGKP